MAATWLAAAALLAAAVALMSVAAGPAPALFHGAPVAVIGSSLVHNAVANQASAAGLLGDGRPHWRIGLNAITQDDTIALLGHAIDEHAQVAIVEANILLFDFSRNQAHGRCDQPAAWLRSRLKRLQRNITDVYARLFGRIGELDEDPDTANFAAAGTLLPESQRQIYPLVLRGPCQRDLLADLGARAQAQGTAIVLLVPPRSPVGEALLGPRQRRLLAARAAALARDMHAAMFIPGGSWRDAEFLDGEHLDPAGRAHFVQALQQWWRTRQFVSAARFVRVPR